MRLFSLFLLLVSFSSCRYLGAERINGSGDPITQQRNASNFEGLTVSGAMDVFVSQGPYSVRIEGDDNLLEYVETEVRNGTLHVGPREGYNLNPRSGLKAYITAPQFRSLSVAGSGDIESRSRITHPDKLALEISGSGNVNLEVDAPQVSSSIAGSGSLSLRGATRDFKANIAGSGEVHAYDLKSETVDVDIAGGGDVEVFASKNLKAGVAGSGDISYKGNPTVSFDRAGSGSIRQVQ